MALDLKNKVIPLVNHHVPPTMAFFSWLHPAPNTPTGWPGQSTDFSRVK
jgi:hypothetical protein